MIRADLYKSIFEAILSNHADVIDQVDELKSELALNGIHNALLIAENDNGIKTSNLKKLVSSMHSRINDEEIGDYSRLLMSIKSYENVSNKRDFIWHSMDFSVINCEQFFQSGSDYGEKVMLIIEQICYVENNRNTFLYYLRSNHDSSLNEYCVTYNPAMFQPIEEWKLYLHGLSLYLNNGDNLPFDSALNYRQTVHNRSFSYNGAVQYNQYVDIYDVISEWNNCSDVLTAFLKMYQVLEYLVYRKELVAIVQGANIKQSFVRQVKGLDRKFTNNERETFKKGLSEVFPSFAGKINVPITRDVESFCTKYYPLTNAGLTYLTQANIDDPQQVNATISKFIYDTRCAIVHNKESEFHITAINYSEYAAIIPLMKNILSVVGESLFEVINDINNGIVFNTPTLNLY